MIETAAVFVLALVVSAFLLDVVRGIAIRWTLFHTRSLEHAARRRHRMDRLEYVREAERRGRAEGHLPVEIGLKLLVGVLLGVRSDVEVARQSLRTQRARRRRDADKRGVEFMARWSRLSKIAMIMSGVGAVTQAILYLTTEDGILRVLGLVGLAVMALLASVLGLQVFRARHRIGDSSRLQRATALYDERLGKRTRSSATKVLTYEEAEKARRVVREAGRRRPGERRRGPPS